MDALTDDVLEDLIAAGYNETQAYTLLYSVFQFQCEILLLYLTFHSVGEGIFACPVGENIIFQELLGNRAGAFGKMKFISDADGGGSYNTFDVDTVVTLRRPVSRLLSTI